MFLLLQKTEKQIQTSAYGNNRNDLALSNMNVTE